jgi:phospholipid/cholesterol/gamma-HCH transport system substrate-binding protein
MVLKMITKTQRVRLGIFTVTSAILFLLFLFAITANQFFKDKDIYYISYQNISVNGLDHGSSVKYLGIKIGTVKKIQIDPNDITRVIITISVDKNTPIKKDVFADISAVGITGIKLIELRGGTNESETLNPGDYIQAGTSLTEEITGKAEIIGEKIELLLNNLIEVSDGLNAQKISNLIDQSSDAVTTLNSLLSKNKVEIDRSLRNIDDISENLAEASLSTRKIVQEIETILNSDTIQTAIGNIAKISHTINKANIYQLVNELKESAVKANRILTDIDEIMENKKDNVSGTIDQLESAVEALNGAAQKINEDPSILIRGSNPANPPDNNLE